ncbi:YlxR family protein [Sinomonas sp. ASV322]|uniref:YlxR family protein n=1 Tax=Sinomonas sp. ASV322 TaxID=3041920 RepID=UPI0027DE40A3|nr:YlxR family protein [Sinomonas sp. ASV322]MDQ4502717.1 YlxR family protein [Sinomonas sp. ASV322]
MAHRYRVGHGRVSGEVPRANTARSLFFASSHAGYRIDRSGRAPDGEKQTQGQRNVRSKAEPLRTCIGCRRTAPRTELLRLVRDPDDPQRVIVDPRRRLPGRGAWLHPDQVCLTQAVKRRAFQRAFRGAADHTAVDAFVGSAVQAPARTVTVQAESGSEI